jgi:hypothetical protein
MKNIRKVAAAQYLLAQAETLGFKDAYITYCDDDGALYESVEDVAKENYAGEITVGIHLVLDEELSFLIEEEEDSDDQPKITFAS